MRRLAILPVENIDLLHAETNPLRRWWLERFPLRELREMGGSLDFLLADSSRPSRPRRRKGSNAVFV